MFTFHEVTYKEILHITKLTIPQGKITCLIGESGSGKSTLLKLMNNMLSPTSGTITYNGTPYSEIYPIELRRSAAMLSQQPALFGDSIRENLEAGSMFSDKPLPSEKEMISALKDFKLSKSLDEKSDQLSGGEQQRLAFARIILMDPDVFLLDEPTSALNEELEHEIMSRFIQHARRNGKTVVYVTHSKKIAEIFSDEVIDVSSFAKRGSDHIGR